jgi:hypothetical protein
MVDHVKGVRLFRLGRAGYQRGGNNVHTSLNIIRREEPSHRP